MAVIRRADLLGDARGGGTVDHFHQVGTSPLTLWQPLGLQNCAAFTTTAWSIDLLRAFPFISGRGGVIDRLGVEQTAAGGANCVGRIGIYANSGNGRDTLYPGALVVETGALALDGANGVKSATISASLAPNQLYWYVMNSGAGTQATIRAAGIGNFPLLLGLASTMGATAFNMLSKSLTYAGALPDPFPASAVGGALATGYVVAVRWLA